MHIRSVSFPSQPQPPLPSPRAAASLPLSLSPRRHLSPSPAAAPPLPGVTPALPRHPRSIHEFHEQRHRQALPRARASTSGHRPSPPAPPPPVSLLPCPCSAAFTLSGRMKPEDAVVATLSSLPDEVVDTVGTVLPSEDSVSERRRKLEFLEMQEELIKEEAKKLEKEEEKAKQKKEEKANLKEPEASEEDLALKEMTEPTAREEELREAKHGKEQLCNISRALAVLASASSVSKERQEFLSLVNKEINLYNSMLEKEGTEGEEEAKKAYKAARGESDDAEEVAAEEKVSSALIDKVDAMLQELEKEIDDVDAQIGNRWQMLDRDLDGKVTPEEVAAAAAYLKDTIGKEGVQELISNLSKDRDGKIRVEDIVKLASQTEENNEDEEEARH